jgi:hypothetical protein
MFMKGIVKLGFLHIFIALLALFSMISSGIFFQAISPIRFYDKMSWINFPVFTVWLAFCNFTILPNAADVLFEEFRSEIREKFKDDEILRGICFYSILMLFNMAFLLLFGIMYGFRTYHCLFAAVVIGLFVAFANHVVYLFEDEIFSKSIVGKKGS